MQSAPGAALAQSPFVLHARQLPTTAQSGLPFWSLTQKPDAPAGVPGQGTSIMVVQVLSCLVQPNVGRLGFFAVVGAARLGRVTARPTPRPTSADTAVRRECN